MPENINVLNVDASHGPTWLFLYCPLLAEDVQQFKKC